ncbi:hypothetical protein [Maribacter sp.]|uniref:hypothetical protein n=1 Tax=Maribacter sp. TaxID=1897614 RepID=UPI003299779B
MKYIFLSIVILMTLSCDNKKEKFTQPKVLKKNARFDLAKITFNEDVKTLISKSLDTTNNDFSYETYSSPTKEELNSFKQSKEIALLDRKGYYFKSFERDSIVQFFGLFASVVEIETDSDFKMQACWATAKVFDSLTLNNVLHKMYVSYGKTNWMKNYQSELGLQEVVYAHTDEKGKVTHEIKYQEYDIDYESYLYEYNIITDYYKQWNLPDRKIQINISKGVETVINLVSGGYENKPYYELEFLCISKSEFDLINNFLIKESTKNNYPMRILKSYYVRELDFYTNFNKYYISETKDGVKTYDFNK